ncbi:DUF6515 family protein [Microbulbifer aggregans]|uniref:DUF6515 family protein n=1 Tax=Microbulbifer aggregans TaxID=1769779 RepID=UPI001CFC7541|nr:DUF6515 family protein [Microbulbifer aggregans]
MSFPRLSFWLVPLLFAVIDVQAQPADQSSLEPREDYSRDPNRVRTLPESATRLQLSSQTYFYQGGYFYRREEDGYLRVEPPLGAQLDFVPYGSTGFDVDGQRFYMSGTGTFYRYDPRRHTYTVTTPPYDWRRSYNGGDVVSDYQDRLYGYDAELEAEKIKEQIGIPRAYPPPAADDERLEALVESERRNTYADPRRRPPRPYANVRPDYDSSGERYDDRALLESACRRDASTAARRGSTLEGQRLRLYKRAYRDCIQRYERRR